MLSLAVERSGEKKEQKEQNGVKYHRYVSLLHALVDVRWMQLANKVYA